MKDTITSPSVPNRDNLKRVYDLLNNIYTDPKLFYSKDEVKKLKKNKTAL